ncbi:MAG: alpha/beta hydrolase [Actinobacteria bacterium]|nr:MAG: alpha/beta hydrolase [Actinomycetota bacterium]
MSLYSEVHGSGPVLLLIPGGNGDAGGYQPLTQELAGRYTVVSYDRRGFGRSAAGPVEAGSVRAGPVEALPVDEAQRFATDVEDAAGLLDRYGGGHGYVFGSSSGAIIALDLLRRYPERAARLVAHEPPLVRLLPDAAQHLRFFDRIYDIYRRDGVDAAMRAFAAGVGLEVPQPPPDAALPPHVVELLERVRANQAYFLEHELRQYAALLPDPGLLREHVDRLVLGVGEESAGTLPYRPAPVLAQRLGTGVAEFPGGHLGYLTHPARFADRLAELL